ncbi:TonB-dependent receptor plug domain-containing protein [Sphingobium sp. CAP-1]|uniref:TonB-dependent receptor plug domain-containing protein n=1 Tax=Sphingobium sp. CAP-1 TaxID=2676077 RepID=UPI0012BB3ED4|nr:TonB-dependent receptor [Sphingobium sp. CAP-1]QGP78091.1 TonB-dependent receptor [Sphingobium sp. CAP-1]
MIIGYDFSRNTPVTARQRSYTSKLDDSTTLWPYQRQHALTGSIHQDILPGVELQFDGLYSRRSTESFYAFSTTGNYRTLGSSTRSEVEAFTLSPELKVHLGDNWSSSLQLVYGRDKTHWNSPQYSGGTALATIEGCYCNSTYGIEANVEGRLATLPGGDLRLAVGGGYRSNKMDYTRTTSFTAGSATVQSFEVSRDSYYAFAEAQLPLVGPAQTMPLVHRLVLTGALRYEDYPGMARVATPKIGIVYAPSPDLDLKGSWGRSFKAPTLYQQYLTGFTWLYSAASYGAGLPAGSTVLFLRGGDPDLRPEKAQTWSASASFHPRALPGFEFDIGYFSVRYSDRVVQPIASASGVLDNPVYADLITRNPDLAEQAAAIAYSSVGLQNLSGAAYVPGNVVAIIDNRYANVSLQKASGFDVAARYSSALANGGSVSIQADATFLKSTREVVAGQGEVQLAGTIFNPPEFRGRGGITYSREDLMFSIWLSHIGSVLDTRRTPRTRIEGQTSLDLNWRYMVPKDGSLLGGVEFSMGIANLLNDKPSLIRTTAVYDVPFDSTNYSVLGRTFSVGLRKSW